MKCNERGKIYQGRYISKEDKQRRTKNIKSTHFLLSSDTPRELSSIHKHINFFLWLSGLTLKYKWTLIDIQILEKTPLGKTNVKIIETIKGTLDKQGV